MGLQNYSSVTENMKAAVGEVDRLVDKGFAIVLSKEEGARIYMKICVLGRVHILYKGLKEVIAQVSSSKGRCLDWL